MLKHWELLRQDLQSNRGGVTSWKKLLSGHRLLRAILREVGATASPWQSFDAASMAVKISYNAQTTQGLPT